MQRGPGCVGPFVTIERSFTGGAFAPTFGAVRVSHARQNDAPFSGAAEAGFEKVNEGQADFAQFDRLDDQGQKVAPS